MAASPRQLLRARAQLSLFEGAPERPALPVALAPIAPPSSPGLMLVVPSPATSAGSPQAPRAASRTRALIDAINEHLPDARVVITDNSTVLLSQSTKDGRRTVRVHQMFLDAPANVRAAVAHYLAHGDAGSGEHVDAFVEAQRHLLELAARPLAKDAHKGRVHDLMPMYVALNHHYFGGAIDAELGWSQPGSPCRKKRRSITFGSWDARARRIVIHPVLDQLAVPTLCIERVLHHEMVHAQVGDERPPAPDGARPTQGIQRIVHGPRFAAEEARFAGAQEADAWFDSNLDALLRWRPGAAFQAKPGAVTSSGRRS